MAKLSVAQIKAARMLLGWSQAELARRSGVSEAAIERLEAMEGPCREETAAKIRAALETRIEFIEEDGGGAGVRLRKGGPRGDPSASIKVEDLTAENDE